MIIPAILIVATLAFLGLWVLRARLKSFAGLGPGGLALTTLVYLGMAVGYSLNPAFLDSVEPSVTVVAQQVLFGRAAYTELGGLHQYNMVYGPALYMANALFLWVFQDPLHAPKFGGLCVALAGFGVLALALWRSADKKSATVGLTHALLFALCFGHYSYWNRADPLLLLFAALGLLALGLPKPWRAVVFGLALACAINTKFFAAAYLAPLFFLWPQRPTPGEVLLIGATTVLGVLMPFGLWPQAFPAAAYLKFLWVVSGQQNIYSVPLLISNLEFTFLLFATPLGLWWVSEKSEKKASPLALGVLLVAVAGVCWVGARKVAGASYLLPFIPVAAHIFVHHFQHTPRLLTFSRALTLTLVCFAALGQFAPFIRLWVFPTVTAEIIQELVALDKTYTAAGQSVQIGYGDRSAEHYIFARPLIYADGRPYFFDASSLVELQAARAPFAQSFVTLFAERQVDIWLVAKPGPPFSAETAYAAGETIFPPEFQAAFLANYHIIASTAHFDVWQANPPP